MPKNKKNYPHKRTATRVTRVFYLVLIAAVLLFLPPHNPYAIRAYSETLPRVAELTAAPSPAPIPINTQVIAAPSLTAEGIVIIDINSGMALFEKNPDAKLLPASTTKIMTVLVALDEYKLDDVVTVATVITEPNVMGLVKGEQISVENLLLGALIPSANDAAYTLAEHDPGGVAGFVEKMNAKAQSLHLTHTHYANPIGFDDPGQFTTAKDLARLSVYALQNKTLSKMVTYPQITVSDVNYTRFHPLKNVNQLLGKVPGVAGLKTGFTQQAGECLVVTAKRNGEQIVIVVLRSEDRFGETEQLINWVFNNFQWKDVTYKSQSP